ncbi:hypothetical protein GCM10025867_39820 [Frondihabitans sucicola]|uniref:DUF402 domain-containing protein n=1 Tax=Frondihabitans sucicola TaxID=1268041 RepID=A0ABM8GTE3_9MICO|nr:hypothetical protein [Frondihabitans sucicola]BDZ51741.1 hypothetical protein GCM10025867_39820 [Frondihabitans sucicola]
MSPRRLFTGPPLAHVLDDTTGKLLTSAANLPARAWAPLEDGTPRDPAADLAAQAGLVVPVFDWESTTTRADEATVVERLANPSPGERRSTPVPGMRVLTTVPFTGSPGLLTSRPSLHYIGGFDTTVTVSGRAVVIDTSGRHVFAATVEAHVARVHADLDRYLNSTSTDLAEWRTSLATALRWEVDARATFLAELSALTAAIATR